MKRRTMMRKDSVGEGGRGHTRTKKMKKKVKKLKEKIVKQERKEKRMEVKTRW